LVAAIGGHTRDNESEYGDTGSRSEEDHKNIIGPLLGSGVLYFVTVTELWTFGSSSD
jgi:hypothetical protein